MRYRILGVTEARPSDDGPEIGLGGSRLRAVLAVLALNVGRPVPPEALIEQVWAADPPADAAGALQALMSRLRRALGRDAVVSEPGGYRLATPRDSVDLYEFERLAREGDTALAAGDAATAADTLTRALTLWRGPALADLPDRTSAAARPEALKLAALRNRVEADLRLGRAAGTLPGLRAAVAEHPLDESFRAQLMRALHAEGRTADALAAYEETRTVLAEALGTDPGPELRALHGELLRRRPPPPAQGNIRARLTSFVGREAELDDIRSDLAAARLVTLTGPGGSGKTRLAQEAGDAAARRHPDGVWLVELAPLDDPSAVPHAVLSALGRRDTLLLGGAGRDQFLSEASHGEDPLARLLEHCAQRRLLLVLDNCEHLIGAAASLAAELLAACPGVAVLATSREPLGVPGEVVRPVEPLPPATAYRLFADRAATVRADARLTTAENDAAVREICRRLDGLPLAIELAAARLRALSPRQIADRLDDRFRLLTSGSRTVLPRQQTLRAVVDWSWELLTERERTTLRGLSVFSGGCTLSAAEAVCGPDALETVAQLVDKSLVVAVHAPTPGQDVRYRLLETIHEYAGERAAERPEELAAAERRHTACFRELARTADSELRGADQLHWLEVLETELDNVRAALNRLVEPPSGGKEDTGSQDAELDAITIALSMGWFWWLRNYRDEADAWLERVTELGGDPPPDPADRMFWPRLDLRMLHFFVKSDHASEAQWSSADSRAMAALLAAAYSQGGPPAARFPGMLWPFTTYLLGRDEEIGRHADTVVANCREYGGEWEIAVALMLRTHIAVDTPGGLARIDADWAELQERRERLGDRWIRAQVHGASAEIEVVRGQYAAAHADFEAAHRLGRELGADGEGAFLLARMGELAHRRGDDEEARKLVEQAGEEAELYSVWDARTYIRYLKALLLLRRGEPRQARELCETAVGHLADGTPPPTFKVLLASLGARITAAEGDPVAALLGLAESASLALAEGCTEPVVGAQLDSAAEVLVELGDLRSAARMSAASSAVRGPLPRTVPELVTADAVEERARAGLGDGEWAAACAEGAVLDASEAVAALLETAHAMAAGS
ncbi:BTAD domain-containing putative transcriptional regulator [Streptomyces sp. NPDC008317]|uniref:BTAD domain-containing putative transcriptional regulator n=1 Tax=Streptomyces sp. NPDC008317 TaxID=3364827 RepID=UPI0036E7D371